MGLPFLLIKSIATGLINNNVKQMLIRTICGMLRYCRKSTMTDIEYHKFATLSSKMPRENGNWRERTNNSDEIHVSDSE